MEWGNDGVKTVVDFGGRPSTGGVFYRVSMSIGSLHSAGLHTQAELEGARHALANGDPEITKAFTALKVDAQDHLAHTAQPPGGLSCARCLHRQCGSQSGCRPFERGCMGGLVPRATLSVGGFLRSICLRRQGTRNPQRLGRTESWDERARWSPRHGLRGCRVGLCGGVAEPIHPVARSRPATIRKLGPQCVFRNLLGDSG